MKHLSLLLLVFCLSIHLSCYKVPSFDFLDDANMAVYKKSSDFNKQPDNQQNDFDYACVLRDTVSLDKKVQVYLSETNEKQILLDDEIEKGDTVTLNWSSNGDKLFITITKYFENTNRLFEYDVSTNILIELPIKNELHYAPMYTVVSNFNGSLLMYLPKGTHRIVEDLYFEKSTQQIKRLSTFLIERNLLQISNEYWFFQPSDSTLLDYHTHFVRWEDQNHLILKRIFWRKSDTTEVAMLFRYQFVGDTIVSRDSAISVPDTYKFNSDYYVEFSNDSNSFDRINKLNGQKTNYNRIYSDTHDINFIVDIPDSEIILTQQTKRLSEYNSAKRIKLLDFAKNSVKDILPNVEHVIYSDIHPSSKSLFFECYFPDNDEIGIIKTDYDGKSPIIISDLKYQVNWFRIRPN